MSIGDFPMTNNKIPRPKVLKRQLYNLVMRSSIDELEYLYYSISARLQELDMEELNSSQDE